MLESGRPLQDTLVVGAQGIERGTVAYWRLALALLLAGFSTFALLYDLQPLLPQFAQRFGVDAATSSFAVSFTTGAMALAFIPAGALSDRIGRRPVMIASLFASATLTLLSAAAPGWSSLLASRVLIGVALAGVPSVAMAYVSEEVSATSVGSAMGLYVAGTGIGGMTGRVGMTIAAQAFGWRAALAGMGAAGLLAAVAFWRFAPKPRAFAAARHDAVSLLLATGRLLRDEALPLLYLEGFLLMGAFVTVYNYAGFRLQAPPYSLSPTAAGAVFLLYILGSISSAWFGGLAGRVGRRKLFWIPIAGVAAGVALTLARPLALVIGGVAVLTVAFFAAHSTASGWVGQRATRDRAQASALYLLLYYLGSSVLGSLGGLAWSHAGWPGVAAYTLALVALALLIALRLARVRPLTDRSGVGG